MSRLSFLNRVKSDWIYITGLRNIDQRTKVYGPECERIVPDLLEESVDKFPQNPAFFFEGETLTYSELEQRSNTFANWALSQGYGAGHTVALFLDNRPDVIALWLGLTKVGVATALLNSNLKSDGLAHCVSSAAPKAVITCEELTSTLDVASTSFNASIVCHTIGVGALARETLDALPAQRPKRAHRASVKGKDLALMIYTSGTTGLPKAARMSHSRCLNMMSSFLDATGVKPSDRIYETLPLYHGTTGLCGIGTALLSGAAVILRRKFSASKFWPDVKQSGATMFVYVGELGRYLMNNDPSPAERDHNIRCAFGNGMRTDVWAEFQKRTGISKIIEFYGSTEGNISLINLDSHMGAIGRIPPLIKDRMPVRLIFVDPQTGAPLRDRNGFCTEAPPGASGEAVGKIRWDDARWRFDGYSDPDATEKKILRNVFDDGDAWFRSGDLLKTDKDGYFYFVDRLGDTFRWKSENVSTGEVETVLSRFPAVGVANVYGVETPFNDGRAGMAGLTLSAPLNGGALYDHVSNALPGYARPVFIRVLADHEVTGTMKLRKADLVKLSYKPSEDTNDVLIIDAGEKCYRPITDRDLEEIAAGSRKL